MQLEKMKAKDLRKWVDNLTKSLRYETDNRNITIYSKWLQEARAEQEARYNRRKRFLDNRRTYYES